MSFSTVSEKLPRNAALAALEVSQARNFAAAIGTSDSFLEIQVFVMDR